MKDIKGYEGIYAVTKDGKVWSHVKKIFRKEYFIGHGYKAISLKVGGVCKHILVHREVAIAFIPNPNNLPQVNHKNGIKTDNRAENLEWVTCFENLSHGRKNGLLSSVGERNSMSKFDKDFVLKIRKEYSNGIKNQKELAKKYGVDRRWVNLVVNRKRWKHI